MAYFTIENVRIAGVSSSVPQNISQNVHHQAFFDGEAAKFIAATGVESKHVVDKSLCSSDLCYKAAEILLEQLCWEKSEVDALYFVSQTPDYVLPSTSCLLQDRLGLSKECAAMDISLGCSGYVYGLSSLASFLSAAKIKKALLLVGDTPSKFCSERDKTTSPLFGDAGTATALLYDSDAPLMHFHLASDGDGAESIIIPDGGWRNTYSASSEQFFELAPGIVRNRSQLILKGMDVFTFGITYAPATVERLLKEIKLDVDNIDQFVFHQANLKLNETIRKKIKIPEEKCPYSLKHYGNTSCASIPLTISANRDKFVFGGPKKLILCGFGVGLSWGSAFLEIDKILCPEIVEYE